MMSSTWRSSSVSAPCISSSICLPSSAERSRTSARQLLPGIADRLHARLHDAFLQFGGDMRQPLQRHLEFGFGLPARHFQSWLRVSTSSETIVIRCSSVSTLTRIDWLAILLSGCRRTPRFASRRRSCAPCRRATAVPAFRGRRARVRRARPRRASAAAPAPDRPARRRVAWLRRRHACPSHRVERWIRSCRRRPARAAAVRARRGFP